MPGNILTPAAALVVWTVVMCIWMGAVRQPAVKALGTSKLKHSARGQDLEGLVADKVQWPAHNYNHLMEQPTIFYAAVFILALSGYPAYVVWLAWLYVVLRAAHSVWQAAVNRQPMRLYLFVASSVVLGVIAVQALLVSL